MTDRHSRQILFEPIGQDGQRRIACASVLVVGCGALGTHLAEFCVRAGVGTLTIIDRDVVEASNLQRQGLFTEADVRAALPKAVAAAAHLTAIDSAARIDTRVGEFTSGNAARLVAGRTVVLDATDNFDTRFLINDACVAAGVPWVYAACVGSTAAAMPVLPDKTACLACLMEGLPAAGGETCDTAGILMPAVLGAVSLASAEALKILAGRQDAVTRRLVTRDVWSGRETSIDASRNRADCPVCVGRRFERLAAGAANGAAVLCGRDSVQVRPAGGFDFARARAQIARAWPPSVVNDYLLRTRLDGLELTLFADGRALVHGTGDIGRARALYAKLVGA